MRAHAIVDEVLEIADGRSSVTDMTGRIADAVARVSPQHAEAVARAIASQQVQRDRLAADMRRWCAARLLPSVYGNQSAAAPTAQQNTVRIVFDPLPTHALPPGGDAIPDADFEVL